MLAAKAFQAKRTLLEPNSALSTGILPGGLPLAQRLKPSNANTLWLKPNRDETFNLPFWASQAVPKNRSTGQAVTNFPILGVIPTGKPLRPPITNGKNRFRRALAKVQPLDLAAGARTVVKAAMKRTTTCITSPLAFCLLWCAAAAGALGITSDQAAAQPPTGVFNTLPSTEQPPLTTEEVAPEQNPQPTVAPAPQATAPGQETVEAPAGQMVATAATPGETMQIPPPTGPEMGDGLVTPPTASTRDWFDFHNWYVQDDFTIEDHPKPKRNIRLLFDTENAQNSFGTRSLALGIAEGTRLTLGYILDREKNRDESVEVTYSGPDHWSNLFKINATVDSASIFVSPQAFSHTPGSLDNSLNQFIGGLNGADIYLIKYQSDMNSLELNYRVRTELGSDQLVYDPDTAVWVRRVGNGTTWSWLVGLRDLELDERINESAVRTDGTIPATGSYNVKVSNNLAAIQFGGEVDYQFQRFFLAVRGSIAPAINFANDATDLTAIDPLLGNVGPINLRAANDGPACVSEFRMEGGYELRPNVRLRLSYDFEWLTSIGLAPTQMNLQTPNPGKILVSNDMMLNGFSAGIDVSW